MVGIGIAQHECVSAVEESEKRTDVEGVTGRARRRWGNVVVDDYRWFIFDEDGNALELDARIVGVDATEIDVDETDGVMDEEDEAAPAVPSSVATDHGEAIEARIAG